ncbi:MAG: cytochrome c [Silicimonas sp.]|nr:cytochrome c [Silicimonas sp.]
MIRTGGTSVAVLLLVASAALAHQGVKNPAVKARMDVMSAIGDNTKLLGRMAKGEVAFDAGTARAAAAAIAGGAERTPILFAAREHDPVSEARLNIWSNFEDFSLKSDALKEAAEAAQGMTSEGELRVALAEIGAACRSCHADYRD